MWIDSAYLVVANQFDYHRVIEALGAAVAVILVCTKGAGFDWTKRSLDTFVVTLTAVFEGVTLLTVGSFVSPRILALGWLAVLAIASQRLVYSGEKESTRVATAVALVNAILLFYGSKYL